MSITKIYRKDNQPFAQIPNEAIRDPQVTQSGFRLLAYLMSHQDGYEVTYEQIERQTGLGRYAINQAADNLTRLGWLEVVRPKLPNGQFGAKSWTVLNPHSATTVGNSTVESPHVERPTDIRRTPSIEEQVKEVINPQPALADAFKEFWAIYPMHREKQDAIKAFEKAVKAVGVEVILEGARKYRDDPYRSKSYTKYPATWLNKGCWDDDPLPPRELTADEKAEKQREINERLRKVEQEHMRQLRAEDEERKRRAVPPPQCDHGASVITCRKCRFTK
jgi:hypothetical protein